MATPEINKYIETRYQGLLDYSTFHCSRAGIPGEASDVLDEVLLSLLQMDDSKLTNLFNTKKCKYTDLDFFILRMIKLNCYSETAPYRAKCKPIPTANVNLYRLNIADVTEPEIDIPEIIMHRFERVRTVFESLGLSPKAKKVFEYKFFQDQSFREWPGTETKKQLYDIYKQVENLIKEKIQGKTLL